MEIKKEENKVLPRLVDITKEVKRIPELKISKELQNSILYCHHKVKGKEWSGVLVYKFNNSKFNIADFYKEGKDIILTAENFLLRDVGTSGGTEFDLTTEEIVEQGNYQMDGYRLGLIHTHHNMQAYFSGVDDVELQTNTPNHEVYVSLVVNYNDGGQPVARICWKGEIETEVSERYSFTFFNKIKNLSSKTKEKESVIFYIDMNITHEVEESLSKKLTEILERKDKKFTYIPGQQLELGGTLELNNEKGIRDCLSRLEAAKYDIKTDYSRENVSKFITYWITNRINENKQLWKILNSIRNSNKEQLDKFEDRLASAFEESMRIFFKEYVFVEDEILLVCYTMKSILDTTANSTNKAVKRILSVIDDIIIEESEDLDDPFEINNPNSVSYDKCEQCKGEGYVFGMPCDNCEDGVVATRVPSVLHSLVD